MWSRQRKPRATIAKGRRKAPARARQPRLTLTVPPTIRDLQYYDVAGTINTNAATWIYSQLFLPTQGTGSTNRYGDKTIAKSMQFFIYVSTASAVPIRVVIFYDKQPNGANPTSPAPMLTASTEAFKDPDLRERFQILRDFWIGNGTNQPIASGEHRGCNHQRGYVRLDNISQFNGNAGSTTDIQTGSFVMAAYNGASTTGAITYSSRILFQS